MKTATRVITALELIFIRLPLYLAIIALGVCLMINVSQTLSFVLNLFKITMDVSLFNLATFKTVGIISIIGGGVLLLLAIILGSITFSNLSGVEKTKNRFLGVVNFIFTATLGSVFYLCTDEIDWC